MHCGLVLFGKFILARDNGLCGAINVPTFGDSGDGQLRENETARLTSTVTA